MIFRLIISEHAQNLFNEILLEYTNKCDVGVLFKAIASKHHSKYKEKKHNNRKWNAKREDWKHENSHNNWLEGENTLNTFATNKIMQIIRFKKSSYSIQAQVLIQINAATIFLIMKKKQTFPCPLYYAIDSFTQKSRKVFLNHRHAYLYTGLKILSKILAK